MLSTEFWAGLGSVLAFILGLLTIALNYYETIILWINKIQALFIPYIQITIPEYGAEHFERSDFYVAIEAYLSVHCADGARKLKAELGGLRKIPLFYVDEGQQIIDTFHQPNSGSATVWWYAYKEKSPSNVIYQSAGEEERRFYLVSFHRRFRESVLQEYMPYVIENGRDVIAKNRQRRLFTNNPDSSWSSVTFQHPATFDTLAMDPEVKRTILHDLDAFRKRKEYYGKVGKPWKRGYLLFGPPGTGKSTMVSAMANYLNYDVYDLELTAVKSNNDLRRLFIDTAGKSIIVIEDIDRSVDLTRRKNKLAHSKPIKSVVHVNNKQLDKGIDEEASQKLTLSGLLNFIDGLWSACGGERIIVFTTNNKGMLDPALIRPGRMDMHIEMSYCSYAAFELLAKNYLDLETINEHDLFERYGQIQHLLEVAKMTPADVTEHLLRTEKDASACLKDLVETLKKKAEASNEEGEDDQEE